MTRQDVLDRLRGVTPDEELQWMLALGSALTVSARGYYPVGDQPGNIPLLIGFNELQHQVFGRIRQSRRGEEWPLESFVDGLLQRAQHYQIAAHLGLKTGQMNTRAALDACRESISSKV
jgi:hypothetical protein